MGNTEYNILFLSDGILQEIEFCMWRIERGTARAKRHQMRRGAIFQFIKLLISRPHLLVALNALDAGNKLEGYFGERS